MIALSRPEPTEWKRWWAWYPVSMNGEWVWRQWIEWRDIFQRADACDFAYTGRTWMSCYEYRRHA